MAWRAAISALLAARGASRRERARIVHLRLRARRARNAARDVAERTVASISAARAAATVADGRDALRQLAALQLTLPRSGPSSEPALGVDLEMLLRVLDEKRGEALRSLASRGSSRPTLPARSPARRR